MKFPVRSTFFLLCLTLATSLLAQSGGRGNASANVGANYILRPLDVILITVFQEPDLEQQVRVSGDGSITLPLIGKINVAGMTLQDATSLVTQLYDRDFIVNPQVSLLLISYTEQRAYVHGQVNAPGPIIIPPEETMTLTQVISAAGSRTRLASDRIQLTRIDENGRKKVIELYFDDILDDPEAKDIEVEDGDTIFIPERFI